MCRLATWERVSSRLYASVLPRDSKRKRSMTMKEEARRFAAADTRRKEQTEIRNESESLLYAAERTLEEYGDKIGKERKHELRVCSQSMREALEKDDFEAIRRLRVELQGVTHEISKVIYGREVPGQRGSSSAGAGTGED